jgi:hypothetical protein
MHGEKTKFTNINFNDEYKQTWKIRSWPVILCDN